MRAIRITIAIFTYFRSPYVQQFAPKRENLDLSVRNQEPSPSTLMYIIKKLVIIIWFIMSPQLNMVFSQLNALILNLELSRATDKLNFVYILLLIFISNEYWVFIEQENKSQQCFSRNIRNFKFTLS